MANRAENSFMFTFTIFVISSMKCHYMSFAHFLFGLFGLFLLLSFEKSRYETSVRHEIWKSFLPVRGLSFQPLDRAICKEKVFNFDKAQPTSFFSFMECAFGVSYLRTVLLTLGPKDFFLCFFSLSVSSVAFPSTFMIHFVLIFA